ncbi:hypothetical protein [Natrinema limicola]|uniref:Uncharacterized protein n=1 Tax=Natrinema limicola JCM 13563 TaxID=1230457 RepID=M0CFD9_9EURY|nr:hypothetical protein [Natrinema limicola]ELZ21975.1 hypothetical protein C476_06072 [Natrinema limicola JCM 13563]
MRHPQDDLLIVYALALLAHEYEGLEKEDQALNLAAEIAEQHGLSVSDAILQFSQLFGIILDLVGYIK